MLNQRLRNLYSFFTSGKKSESVSNSSIEEDKQAGKASREDSRPVRLVFHGEMKGMQPADARTEVMAHDWWIN